MPYDWRNCPEPSLDPPEYPDPPEADRPCEECGKTEWNTGDDMGDGEYRYGCTATVDCAVCHGTGVPDGDKKTKEELVLAKLADEVCPDCDNGKVMCEGQLTFSPPEPPEPERDRD